MRTAVLAVLIAGIASPLSCRSEELIAGVNDTVFVRALADLQRVPALAGHDTVRRTAMRDSILRSHGLTATQLETAARRLADAPERAERVWREIDRRTGSTAEQSQPGPVVAPTTTPR